MTNSIAKVQLGGRHLTLGQRVIVYVPASIVAIVAIIVAEIHPYTQGSDFGYFLGLVGGCMLLTLFFYPIRKYWQPAQRLGSLRSWFMVHIVFGFVGPILILFHSSFQTKSVNGAVALWSTVIVVISGMIGRFVYVHMYEDLDGRRATLRELEENLERRTDKTRHGLNLAPKVNDMLADYLRHVFATREFTWGKMLSFIAIGWQGERLISRCKQEIVRALKEEAELQKWPRNKFLTEKDILFALVEDYVRVIDTTGRFAYWERMLAWWHLIHVPMACLLLVSGIMHVIAVHLY